MLEKLIAKKGWIISLGVLLASTLASCGPEPPRGETPEPMPTMVEPTDIPQPTDVPIVTPTITPPPPEFTCTPLEPETELGYDPTTYRLSDEGLYLDGLVIVTGRNTEIDGVMAQVLGTTVPPQFIEEISLDDQVIRLYEYSTTDYPTIWDIILAIYLTAAHDGFDVDGDANYLLGDPWDVQGSPWDVQGSPWDVQGSPWVPITATAGLDNESLFWGQWGLTDEPHGIGHHGSGGQGKRVAIFDTSPFQNPGPYVFDFSTGPDLQLCVSHPLPVVSSMGGVDYKEHGVAVAGLAHAVASESNIDLIKVLNDNAEGDLFTLLKSMSLFLQKIIDERGRTIWYPNSLSDVIVNLSLGFRPEHSDPQNYLVDLFNFKLSPEEYLFEYSQILERVPLWNELEEAAKVQKIIELRTRLQLLDQEAVPVQALRFLVRFATNRGAVVVAAAGNESPSTPSQRPALWPEVLGVGASTLPSPGNTPEQACFSNIGDVYASGGNGDGNCQSQLQQCAAQPQIDCKFGLISLVTAPNIESDIPNGIAHYFAYWVGTSFSTPLVSGLVSLHLEDGIQPDQMAEIVETQGEDGEKPGVIHIPSPTPVP